MPVCCGVNGLDLCSYVGPEMISGADNKFRCLRHHQQHMDNYYND